MITFYLRNICVTMLLLASLAYAQRMKSHTTFNTLDTSKVFSDYTMSTPMADSNFTQVGEWRWGPCDAAAIKDHYLYMGNGRLLQIFDISIPDTPVWVKDIPMAMPVDMRIRDSLLFILSNGLHIYNIADPLSLTELSYFHFSTPVFQLEVDDSLAYIRVWGGGAVLDITNPHNPTLCSTFGTNNEYGGMLAVHNRFIYVGGWPYPSLKVIDARDPYHLKIASVIYDGIPFDACVVDTVLYLLEQHFSIYGVSDPYHPDSLGMTIADTVFHELGSITVHDNYAFVVAQDTGIYTFNISNLRQPVRTGFVKAWVQPTDYGNKIIYHNNYLYIPAVNGLLVMNAQQPDSLVQTAFLPAGGFGPKQIAIKGNFAITTLQETGLATLDITDITNPHVLSFTRLPGNSTIIKIVDDQAYVVSDSIISILDITDPVHPFILNSFFCIKYINDVSIDDHTLYVLGHRDYGRDPRLLIYDVTNDTNVTLSDSFQVRAERLVVKNSFAYIAGGDSGFVILDVSRPDSIIELSRISGFGAGILLEDTIAYAALDSRLSIYNVSNPSSPIMLGEITTPGSRSALTLSKAGDYVYMSYSNIVSVNISNYSSPQLSGLIENTDITGIMASDKYLFTCFTEGGLIIYKNDKVLGVDNQENYPFGTFRLEQNYPNPFNPTTVIRYQLSVKSAVTLRVYDMLGREVATFIEGTKYPGTYQITWDGSGYTSGIYFYMLTVLNNRGNIYSSLKLRSP